MADKTPLTDLVISDYAEQWHDGNYTFEGFHTSAEGTVDVPY